MSAQTYTITLGGWYQRTTLHLTELSDFFTHGVTRLNLNKQKIQKLYEGLNLEFAVREASDLEYIKAKTNSNIGIRYYEDGLYILELESSDITKATKDLSHYFENIFEPAISYLFSLGAPTPKVLANIKRYHPTVVCVKSVNHQKYKIDEEYGEVYSQITSGKVNVYKTPHYIFIVSSLPNIETQSLVEAQIFFREFKDQLEKYLQIHRYIWEEIATIKERGQIKGGEVVKLRSTLESYKTTIDLISNRINQMGAYVGTRKSQANDLQFEKELIHLFQYKFDTLTNTHSYIKELWKMTSDYLDAAIKVVLEVENKSTNVTIRSLQLITTVGVVSGVLGYLSKSELPKFNQIGLIYFTTLLSVTWLINSLITLTYRRLRYKLKFSSETRNI